MRYLPAACTVLVGVISVGCSTPPPPTPGVSDTGPTSLKASDAYPHIVTALKKSQSSESKFSITSGEYEGETGTRRVEADGESAVVSWLVGGQETLNQSVLTLSADGALTISKMPNRERDVVTRFVPEFTHFPAELDSDTPVEQELRMLVASFDRPGNVTRRGDSTSTLTLLGSVQLTVDGTMKTALVVRAVLLSTFGPANVTRTTDRWFVPGIGLVGESYEEVVKIFGVESERRQQTIWLEGVAPPVEIAPKDTETSEPPE